MLTPETSENKGLMDALYSVYLIAILLLGSFQVVVALILLRLLLAYAVRGVKNCLDVGAGQVVQARLWYRAHRPNAY